MTYMGTSSTMLHGAGEKFSCAIFNDCSRVIRNSGAMIGEFDRALRSARIVPLVEGVLYLQHIYSQFLCTIISSIIEGYLKVEK